MLAKRKRRWLLFSAIVLTAVLSGAGYIGFRMLETRSMACECEDPMDGERFGTWNPFRDRGAEHAGEQVLQAVRAGKCESVPAMRPYCGMESRLKVVSWKLTGRSSDSGGVQLRYWVIRAEARGAEFGDPVWINVERKDGRWQASSASLYY